MTKRKFTATHNGKNSILSTFGTHEGIKTCYFVAKAAMKFLRKQRNTNGCKICNGDFMYHYNLLKENHKSLYIKEFSSVLLLTTSLRKMLAKEFLKDLLNKK